MMQIKLFELNPLRENTYLLYDETGEAAMIDCGASTLEEQAELTNFIERNNLKLKHLLNTHLHYDHIWGNRFIYDTYGLKPQYHEWEETKMPGLREQAAMFGLDIPYEPVAAEHFLNDDDIVHFGNTEVHVLLTPGHSPGGLSFYAPKGNSVFTGDALFHYDIGRTDLWGGSDEVLINAIKTKLLTLPEETVVYPGHGIASIIKKEKAHNPYLK